MPASLAQQRTNRVSGTFPGLDAIQELVHAGLTHADDKGTLHAQLAEAVPSTENGLWRVFPDGRMEITWTIKQDARWQDGTPVTTDDLAFAAQVEQDRDLGIPRAPFWDLIEAIEATDARTLTVRWSQPYIEADALFSHQYATPIPAHLLATAYRDDRDGFLAHPYWSNDFIGAGPFRMQEWVPESHVVVVRNDDYVLGRPKLDEIEVRFVPDPNTLVANLLARAAEMTLGRSLIPIDQATLVQQQLGDARIATAYRSWYPLHAQFIDTNPPIVGDVRFRRALLHALDRQNMADTFIGPTTAVAHSYVGPDTPGYEQIEPSIIRYEYDPRRAGQMIEALGYTRGPDGFFVDRANQRLTVEVRTTIRATMQPKIVAAVAEDWKRSGVDVDEVHIPPQRMSDREYRATFPGFEMPGGRNGLSTEDVMRFHSSSTPLPENRFQSVGNYSRHRSAELDSIVEQYIRTVPYSERLQVIGRFARYQTDLLPSMGLFYQVDCTLIGGRILGVTGLGREASQAWNAEQWDVTT